MLASIQSLLSRCTRGVILAAIVVASFPAWAEQRFPPPEFESGHQLPATTVPAPRGIALEYFDVAVLAAALGLASWLMFRKRSRKGIIALSLFSLIYFGFWRKGCICAIGSLQNVSLGLLGSGYTLPVSVLAFFVLPLAVALFAGRAFCAAVCPHGALQDLVLLKPIKVPRWLEHGLGVLPFIYLGAGVLFAATGSAFIICQYDPFVPVFRMNGRSLMVLSGIALLILGMFVGRPYCRFICPFGALLKVMASFTRLKVRVTPAKCTQCRLCEHSCPFGAMREPELARSDSAEWAGDRRRMAAMFATIPLLIVLFGYAGWAFSGTAAKLNPTVALANRLEMEKDTPPKTGVLLPADLELARGRQIEEEVRSRAVAIRDTFKTGTTIFGLWIGLVLSVKLVSLSLRRGRTDYEPEQSWCVGCARCFETCPDELLRRGIIPPFTAVRPAAASPERPGNAPEALRS